MKLEELEVYNLSMDLADKVYHVIEAFDYFHKDTLGKQWIRAVDSVSLNLSEGFGRYTYKDSRVFSIIARGSLYESRACLNKVFRRNIISEEVYREIMNDHNHLGIKLNNFIRSQTNLIKNNH
ncbi:MAG: four helix bundle protein [Proteiniphilum sp.]